ncbi:cytochrome c-type biogenesis protein CcmH [Silvibacterium sp.]|uniref:cytochrome c-type biogenesis protein CcmH n=1 Tax=Silvibacterium sp. TaxID=1964179 RepID=UPI0039E5AEB2
MQVFAAYRRRAGAAVMVILLAVLTMGAADNGERMNDLGHKMMCACGCGQVLIECNHVGCPSSGPMLDELRAQIEQGQGDTAILTAFETKYGPTVLAAPMFTRFNMLAWIMPPLLLLLGIGGTAVLIRRWRQRAAAKPAPIQTQQIEGIRERVRRETEL